MGKYYCDYCDIYLTHDSMNARKAHNTGRNHIANVRDYFASLNHDKAQNIIDQIIQSHESGGRQQMMMAPSMRLGAGFLNPMTTQQGPFPPSYPPQGSGGPPFPPPGMNGAPPFRPPFPPPGGAFPPPHFNPSGAPPPFPPNAQAGPGFPPGFPAGPGPGPNGLPFRPPVQSPPQGGGGTPNSSAAPSAVGPPPSFTPASQSPAGAAPGIHPDRLRMMGNR